MVSASAKREIGVVAIGVVLVVGALMIARYRDPGQGQVGQAAPTATMVTPSHTSHVPAATPPPEMTPTPAVMVPDDAPYKTPQQAGAYAVQIAALKFKAQNPQIATVELLTLETAMRVAQLGSGEDPAQAMAGFDPSEATDPTWRVGLTGTRFYIPKCPPPDRQQATSTPITHCGWMDWAVISFSAYGQLRETHLPFSPP
jgi:hypothetical protein